MITLQDIMPVKFEFKSRIEIGQSRYDDDDLEGILYVEGVLTFTNPAPVLKKDAANNLFVLKANEKKTLEMNSNNEIDLEKALTYRRLMQEKIAEHLINNFEGQELQDELMSHFYINILPEML